MDPSKMKDPRDLKKQLEAQEQSAKEPQEAEQTQAKHAKQARAAQVQEPVGPRKDAAASQAVGESKEGAKVQDEGPAGEPSTKETQKAAGETGEAMEAKEAKEAGEAKEAPPVEQKAALGEEKAPEAKGTEGGEGRVEQKAAEGEQKAAEVEKKATDSERKASAEGKTGEKDHGGAVEQKSTGGGVDTSQIRWTPTDANNASVQSPVPPSLQQSETILNASQSAADSQPVVSPQTAAQPPTAQVGWATKVGQFAQKTLRSAFLGNFDIWNPAVPGRLHKAFADWSDFSKAKGIDKVIAFMDHAYGIVDAILGFTGPLGTVLGIVSYARYIPIPPIPAIGSALYVVSEVLKGISFVLEIVKAAIALLRPILTVVAMCTTKDPEKRKQYQQRLTDDIVDFAASGFSVVMTGVMDRNFWTRFSVARKSGAGVLGAIGKGYGGLAKMNWQKGFGIFSKNRASDLYRETLDEALERAMAGRQVVSYRQQVKTVDGAPVTTRSDVRMDYRKGAEILAGRGTQYAKATGDVLSRTGRTTYSATGQVLKQDVFISEVGKGLKWDAGRVREVLIGSPSDMFMGGSVLGDVVQATATNRAATGVESGVRSGVQFFSPSAPQGGPPVTPQVQADVDRAGKATEQSLKNNQTPLLKNEPVPPQKTSSAPDHLKAIKAQQEVMKSLSKEAEAHVAAAKAGQEEGKALQEAAKQHRKGAEHAKAEAANHLQALQKDQQDVRKGRQKVQEGIKQQQKGKEGFGKVESEGSRAKGAVPGGRVNRDDIPWYKRVYLWVVDKFEGAKAQVTQAMTGVVMKAVQGATGFADVGQTMQQADQQTKAQDQVLAQEPAVVLKVQSLAQKEAQAATEGEQKGAQRVAENQKAEAAGQQALQETKKQEAALQKEEQQVQAESAKYEGTYGKSFDKLNKHADAADAGDLTPLEIQLNQEIAALQEAVSKLLNAIAQHHGQVEAAVGQNVSKFREAATQLDGERRAKAVTQAESLGAEFRGRNMQTRAERMRRAEGLAQAAQAHGGKAADVQAIEAVSKLLGEALAEARDFDQQKQSELDEMHQAFTQQYEALFQ